MSKAEIRLKMQKHRNTLSTQEQMAQSRAIHKKLFALEAYYYSSILLTFASFHSEIDTWPILNHALLTKKHVFLPRVEGKRMDFYEVHDTTYLEKSNFGILEPIPKHTNQFRNSDNLKGNKVMLLPGLAFDYDGNRIGYGGGYYDRFLSADSGKEFLKIALAFDFQLIERMIPNAYDVNVDIIITPNQIIQCNKERSTR